MFGTYRILSLLFSGIIAELHRDEIYKHKESVEREHIRQKGEYNIYQHNYSTDATRFKTTCVEDFMVLGEVFPAEMSPIERDYVCQKLNWNRNQIATGNYQTLSQAAKLPPIPASKTKASLLYELYLEYLAVCLLREDALWRFSLETYHEEVAMFNYIYGFEGELLFTIYYFMMYDRPFEMRKTLWLRAIRYWTIEGPSKFESIEALSEPNKNNDDFVQATHDWKPILLLIASDRTISLGCAKMIAMKYRPKYSYECMCVLRWDGNYMYDIVKEKQASYKFAKAYPNLVLYNFEPSKFVPPLDGVIFNYDGATLHRNQLAVNLMSTSVALLIFFLF